MRRGSRVLFAVLVGCGLSAQAREYYDLNATPRTLAMGHAITAVASGYDALYANPAGLASMEEWQLRLPDVGQLTVSPALLDIARSVKAVSGQSTAQLVNSLSQFDGKGACGGAQLLGAGYYSRRLTIAFNPLSTQGCFRVRTPSALFARAKVRLTVDWGLSVGTSQGFFDNSLRLGIALRPFLIRAGLTPDRGSQDRTLENTEIVNLRDNLSTIVGVGWGYDFDAGAQYTVPTFNIGPIKVRTETGIALQNALATEFSNRLSVAKSVDGHPPALERKVNLGVAFTADNWRVMKPTLAFEWRELLIATDSWMEHLSVGGEMALNPSHWLATAFRLHFDKGNVGGGVGFRLAMMEVEFGTYAVNLGRGIGVGRDRRVYGQGSLVW